MSKFIIVKHKAKKRGDHFDIRFKMPNSKNWASFATGQKVTDIPTKPGEKINIVRTHDHSEKEALYLGTIEDGQYGAGELIEYDSGRCDVLKFTNTHMIVDFKGRKIKGKYHFINALLFSKDKRNKRIFVFFKSKK